jgi:hypothetical protein
MRQSPPCAKPAAPRIFLRTPGRANGGSRGRTLAIGDGFSRLIGITPITPLKTQVLSQI